MTKQDQLIYGFRDVMQKLMTLNEDQMRQVLAGYKPSEIHCLEYIGQNPDANLTSIAEAFFMTRGAISKLTKRMVEKGLIERYKHSDNQKEVHLRLTQEGQSVFETHQALHDSFQARDQGVFETLSQEVFETIIGFTDRYSAHLDMELRKKGIVMTKENLEHFD